MRSCIAGFISLLIATQVTAQNPPVWRLVENLRIGSVDDEATALTRISSIRTDARGNIYVVPVDEEVIRVFDRTGKPLRRIGGKGAGPGEFESLSSVGFRGDTLYASDARLRRTSLFTADGKFIRSINVSTLVLPRPLSVSGLSMLLPDGSAVVIPGQFMQPGSTNAVQVPILRVTREARILDTIVVIPRTSSSLQIQSASSTMFTNQPFSDDPLSAYSGTHMFVVDRRVTANPARAQFRITKIAMNGDTIWSRPYNYVARELTSAVTDSITNAFARGAGRGMTPEAAAAAYRKAALFPKFWPPIATATITAQGGLWLKLNEGNPQTNRWLVLDADGRVLATVNIPGTVRVAHVEGDQVYASTQDEMDVPYVVRYRIQK